MAEQIDNRVTSDYWLTRDHEEALRLNRQLRAAGAGITVDHIIDLNRFYECAEDGEGYDVPKERMRELRRIGLVDGGRFGYYRTTDKGNRIWRA